VGAAEQITDAELLEKAHRARTRKSTDAGEPSAPTELTEHRHGKCERPDCGASFTYEAHVFGGTRAAPDAPIVGGKEMFRPRWCPPCVQADLEARARVGKAQATFENKMAEMDAETRFRSILEGCGGNPWEHGHATLENFDTSESGPEPRVYASQFVEAVQAAGPYDAVRGLYLWGDTGPGKSHLAIAVIRELLQSNYAGAIVFDHAAELIARIQDTYGRKEASTFDVLEKRFNAGLWILDDFGTERPSDDVVRHLTLIFGRRALRPTLVTSNLSPATLDAERPDLMRVLSRLGPKYFRVVEVKGRDRRFD
jgi:DNA replication protein DnaC